MPKFTKKTEYYTGTVWEWNLPTGHTCPFAVECLVKVNRETGKFTNDSDGYKCYAAAAERFPGVRNMRWDNYEYVKNGGIPELNDKIQAVRIHASGDFFSQDYFDMWLQVCRDNPEIEFWAYTKSINYWVKRKDEIPDNLALTASRGSKLDPLIEEHNLRCVHVINPNLGKRVVAPEGSPFEWLTFAGKDYPIDTNDDVSRVRDIDFVLLDNNVKASKTFFDKPIGYVDTTLDEW